MRSFLFAALTALTAFVGSAFGAAPDSATVKAVTENGVISLYRGQEAEPFAALPAQTESGDVLEVVKIDGPFVAKIGSNYYATLAEAVAGCFHDHFTHFRPLLQLTYCWSSSSIACFHCSSFGAMPCQAQTFSMYETPLPLTVWP